MPKKSLRLVMMTDEKSVSTNMLWKIHPYPLEQPLPMLKIHQWISFNCRLNISNAFMILYRKTRKNIYIIIN